MNNIKFHHFILLVLNASALSSCAVRYGNKTMNSYGKIAEAQKKEYADFVLIFMEGEELDFKYTKLGLVEATGKQYASLNEVMHSMKHRAWLNYANAIIMVKSDKILRKEGQNYLFSDEYDSETNYTATHLSGIAVQIEIDSAFIAKYGAEKDPVWLEMKNNYLTPTQIDSLKQSENSKKKPFGQRVLEGLLIVAFVGFIGVAAIYYTLNNSE